MKFKIVVEDKKKGRIEIPLNSKEISALGGLAFYLDEAEYNDFKSDKIDKPISSSLAKFTFLLFDVFYDGRVHKVLEDGKGNFIKDKHGHFKTIPAGHTYLVKKPKWRK